MIIEYRYILGEIHEVRKGLWAFFLDRAFRMLGRQTLATWKFDFMADILEIVGS